MYLTATKNHWACDIEADGLYFSKETPLPKNIWCVTLCNLITKKEIQCLTKEEFLAFQQANPDAVYVGHNFLAYDAFALGTLWKAKFDVVRIVDTFLLSMMYEPSRPITQHGLDYWGQRLNYPKGEWNDYSGYSPGMLSYCIRDTRLAALLFLKLSARMRSVGFTERSAEIEHRAWHIIQNRQRRHGFWFDVDNAERLLGELRGIEKELSDVILKLWPPKLRVVATRATRFRKDGSFTAQYHKDRERFHSLREYTDGHYDCLDWEYFNLASPVQRIDKLLSLGWEPTSFTEKGNPKVDEDSLLAFAEKSGSPEVAALAKWIVVNGRANMVTTWIGATDPDTHSIHGSLFLASTFRYKHSQPNSANIPAVRTRKNEEGEDEVLRKDEGAWTYETRALFTSTPGRVLVGLDGKGLQARCLAHNIARVCGEDVAAEFISDLLEGDIHKKNIERFGFPNKPASKKAFYTILMGGGKDKIAADQIQFGWEPPSSLKDDIVAGIPGFQKLINYMKAELRKRGRIILCDGTPILVPSDHMVIPYLLQGDESRLMKQAMIYLDEEIADKGWRKYVDKVADIHDEWQYEVDPPLAEEFIDTALPCFNKSGESFGYLIRIDGDAKCGMNWAETH